MSENQLPNLIVYSRRTPNLDPRSVSYYQKLLENWEKRLPELTQNPSESAIGEIKKIQSTIIDHQKEIGRQTRKIKNLLPSSYEKPGGDQKQVLRKLKLQFSSLISGYSAAWRGMKMITKRQKSVNNPPT